MTGLDGHRVYLDWNATAPLRPEARAAMLAAMDAVGNPSSVHAEGRAAKKIVETARRQVARLVGCDPSGVVFSSGATEAANTVITGSWLRIVSSEIEHDCVRDPVAGSSASAIDLPVPRDGVFPATDWLREFMPEKSQTLLCIQAANSETGVEQNSYIPAGIARDTGNACLTDAVQSAGKRDLFCPADLHPADFRLISGHKFGGPKGVGALLLAPGRQVPAPIKGGGQEQGRRSGTENVIGIAGFGAAAEAAQRDLEDDVWLGVEKLRNILEERLESAAPDLTIFGREAPRLPNTSCFAMPEWWGETQVMQLDLAGFAVSAGSACSSGKVNKASRVLLAMGFDETMASSAIRVSLGPTTTEPEVMAFADTWIEHYRKRSSRAA